MPWFVILFWSLSILMLNLFLVEFLCCLTFLSLTFYVNLFSTISLFWRACMCLFCTLHVNHVTIVDLIPIFFINFIRRLFSCDTCNFFMHFICSLYFICNVLIKIYHKKSWRRKISRRNTTTITSIYIYVDVGGKKLKNFVFFLFYFNAI